MCGVIGIKGKVNPNLIKKLFIETQIRGRHATGVSFWFDGQVHTIRESVPAEDFVEMHDPAEWFDGEEITMIGHCRYSTSDLEFNQPIADRQRGIVHNGVITEESPDRWEELFGIRCDGKNDTELLFRSSPDRWSDSSIAMVELKDGDISWTRNGKRPLWSSITESATVVASTRDILKRAGIIHATRVNFSGKDLQHHI